MGKTYTKAQQASWFLLLPARQMAETKQDTSWFLPLPSLLSHIPSTHRKYFFQDQWPAHTAPSLSLPSHCKAPSCCQPDPCAPPDSTFTKAAAARKLILATDSRFRRRGRRLKPERELVKEQSDVAPGVIGVWGMLQPSLSSAIRKARPRAKGSMICPERKPISHLPPSCCLPSLSPSNSPWSHLLKPYSGLTPGISQEPGWKKQQAILH